MDIRTISAMGASRYAAKRPANRSQSSALSDAVHCLRILPGFRVPSGGTGHGIAGLRIAVMP